MMLEEFARKIEGPLREPLLILDWVVFFLFLELAQVFLIRILSQEKSLKNLQDKSYMSLFFGFSFSKLFYIIGDYYVLLSFRMVFYNVAYLIQMTGLFFFIYNLETYRVFIKKYLFTRILTIFMVAFISILIFANTYTQIFSYSFFLIFFVFLIIYFYAIVLEFYVERKLGTLKHFLMLCAGIFFVILGYGLATDFAASIFGLEIRALGDLFEISGFFLLFLFFISIPSFSEYDWQDKINSIYITQKDGLFLFKRNFISAELSVDQNIVAGLLTSVKVMLQALTDKKGVSIIERENKIMIIYPSEFVNGIIICDEKLASLQILLKKFVNKVELLFRNIFENWNGDVTVFSPLEDVSKEIFY